MLVREIQPHLSEVTKELERTLNCDICVYSPKNDDGVKAVNAFFLQTIGMYSPSFYSSYHHYKQNSAPDYLGIYCIIKDGLNIGNLFCTFNTQHQIGNIVALSVDRDYKNTGIGSLLFIAAIDVFLAYGIKSYTLKGTGSSMGFYRKFGLEFEYPNKFSGSVPANLAIIDNSFSKYRPHLSNSKLLTGSFSLISHWCSIGITTFYKVFDHERQRVMLIMNIPEAIISQSEPGKTFTFTISNLRHIEVASKIYSDFSVGEKLFFGAYYPG